MLRIATEPRTTLLKKQSLLLQQYEQNTFSEPSVFENKAKPKQQLTITWLLLWATQLPIPSLFPHLRKGIEHIGLNLKTIQGEGASSPGLFQQYRTPLEAALF